MRNGLGRVVVLGLTALVVVALSSLAAAQPSVRLRAHTVLLMERPFIEYNEDFLDFAQDRPVDQQRHNYEDLASIAGQTIDYLDATRTLLKVYESLTSERDKAAASQIIRQQLKYYVKLLGVKVSEVNWEIANTRAPAVTAEATRMRADIRRAKATLDSAAQ